MILNSGIYRIVNKINRKSYFGQAVNLKKRWGQHKWVLRKGIHDNKHLQNSFNKYGEDAFIFTIHLYCPIEDLDKEEQICLDLCKRVPELFYNQSYDVEHPQRGIKRSKETIKKMSLSQKGKIITDETKKRMSLSQKGKHHSTETKQKMSLSQKGKHLSEEHKKKLSLSKNGNNHPRYDHTIYHFYNKKLNIKENCTRNDLRNKYKLDRNNLSSVINGKRKSAYGWTLL